MGIEIDIQSKRAGVPYLGDPHSVLRIRMQVARDAVAELVGTPYTRHPAPEPRAQIVGSTVYSGKVTSDVDVIITGVEPSQLDTTGWSRKGGEGYEEEVWETERYGVIIQAIFVKDPVIWERFGTACTVVSFLKETYGSEVAITKEVICEIHYMIMHGAPQ